jgi:hypothetical protein
MLNSVKWQGDRECNEVTVMIFRLFFQGLSTYDIDILEGVTLSINQELERNKNKRPHDTKYTTHSKERKEKSQSRRHIQEGKEKHI